VPIKDSLKYYQAVVIINILTIYLNFDILKRKNDSETYALTKNELLAFTPFESYLLITRYSGIPAQPWYKNHL